MPMIQSGMKIQGYNCLWFVLHYLLIEFLYYYPTIPLSNGMEHIELWQIKHVFHLVRILVH